MLVKNYTKIWNKLLRVAGFIRSVAMETLMTILHLRQINPETNKLEDIRGYFIP